jgi:hypothetical protein
MSRKRPRDGRLRLRVLSDDDHAGGCKSVWRDLKVVGRRLVLEDASSQVESRAVTWADKARVSTELRVFIRGKRTVRRAAQVRALWIDASSHDNLMSAHRHSHRSTFAHHSHLCIRPQRQNDRRPPAARIRFRFIAISATNSRLAWLPTAPTAANVGGGQAGLPRTR